MEAVPWKDAPFVWHKGEGLPHLPWHRHPCNGFGLMLKTRPKICTVSVWGCEPIHGCWSLGMELQVLRFLSLWLWLVALRVGGGAVIATSPRCCQKWAQCWGLSAQNFVWMKQTQEEPRMASSDPPRAPKGLGAGAGMATRSHRLCSVLWYDVSWLFSGFVQQIMLSSASAEKAFVLLSLSPVLGSLFTLEAYKNVRFLTLWCQNRGYSKQIEKPSKMLGFFNVTPKQICAGQSLCS